MKKLIKKRNLWAVGMIALFSFGTACQKDRITDLPDDERPLKEVTFRVRGFETIIQPLLKMDVGPKGGALPDLFSVQKVGNVPASELEQLMYFWSFNAETTVPDVGIDSVNTGIYFTGNNGGGSAGWVNGKSSAPYPAGRAYSLTGPQEVRFKIPVSGVTALRTLSFDAGSSNTGPKDFIFSYSLDDTTNFTVLVEENPFENTNASAWNRFEYDLSSLPTQPATDTLWLKIALKGGDRENVSPYSETTGTFRIDNFGLTGIYTPSSTPLPEFTGGTFHYYLFQKQDSTLVSSGQLPFSGGKEDVPEITVALPEGVYFGSFVVNFSDQELLVPAVIERAQELYMRNPFDNTGAVIFGTMIPELTVEQDVQRELTLERYYSEVHFQFLDDADLSEVEKISITEVYPVYYKPFSNGQGTDPGEGETALHTTWMISPDWSDDLPEIHFNQFIGMMPEPTAVAYTVDVYGAADELLRTFTVQASVFHNTRLIFSGNLLQSSATKQTGFPIHWNEDWGETQTVPF